MLSVNMQHIKQKFKINYKQPSRLKNIVIQRIQYIIAIGPKSASDWAAYNLAPPSQEKSLKIFEMLTMRNVRVCRKMMVQRQQFVSSSGRVFLKGIQRALKIAQSSLLQNSPIDYCHKKTLELCVINWSKIMVSSCICYNL